MIPNANTSSADSTVQQRYAQSEVPQENQGKADTKQADSSLPAARLHARQKSEASIEWQQSAAGVHLSEERTGDSAVSSQQGSEPKTKVSDSEPLSLGEAVFAGDIHAIYSLIAAGASVNGTDYDGNTWLHLACTRTSAETLRALLSLGADVNHADDNGRTALHFAVEFGSVDMIRILLEFGADINRQTHGGRTALHFACESGSAQMIRTLLDSGADVNHQTKGGRTPLHFAARNGNGEANEVLLNRGADLTIRDKLRSTPLHHAAQSGNVEAITILLKKHPAIIDWRDKAGLTALDWAGTRKQVQAIELLMSNGADPN